MGEQHQRPMWNAAVWVLIVVSIGVALGAVVALTVRVPAGPPMPPPPPAAVAQLAVLLSVVCLALLTALVVVYVRNYRVTRAPYVLGVLVFLAALLFETALNSPLAFAAFGLGPGSLGRFLVASELVMAVALSIFLYLTLQ